MSCSRQTDSHKPAVAVQSWQRRALLKFTLQSRVEMLLGSSLSSSWKCLQTGAETGLRQNHQNKQQLLNRYNIIPTKTDLKHLSWQYKKLILSFITRDACNMCRKIFFVLHDEVFYNKLSMILNMFVKYLIPRDPTYSVSQNTFTEQTQLITNTNLKSAACNCFHVILLRYFCKTWRWHHHHVGCFSSAGRGKLVKADSKMAGANFRAKQEENMLEAAEGLNWGCG
ncbi:hypothetical protein AMECASPLE_021589 [Ameca splendens]|uniref:Uncharacterized protein n=1 Tax=Ameca splendens TaxID=208324 RepID=A0ABV0YQH6_9TELE